MKIKRLLASVLSVTMVGAALAGCGNSNGNKNEESKGGAQSGAETQAIKLKVWSAQEDQVSAEGHPNGLLATLCEQFNELHPEWDITFDYGVVSEADAGDEALKDLDVAADVFFVGNDHIAKLVDAGAIAKLGGSVLSDVEENVSASMLGSVTYKDGVYGIPFVTNTYFMYYDKSIFTEDEVKSLETMLNKDLADGVHAFSMDLDNSWYMPSIFYAAGGELFGPNGDDEAAGTTFGEKYEATEYLINLNNNEKVFVEDQGISLAKFADRTLGAYISGSWDAAAIKEALGDDFGVTKLPTINLNGTDSQMMSFAGSKAVVVKSNSEHLAASVALAAYLGGEEAQKVRFEVRGFTPTWKTVEALPEVQADALVSAEILQINEASKTQPLVSKIADFWGPMETLGKAVVQGDVTMDNYEEATRSMGEGIMS